MESSGLSVDVDEVAAVAAYYRRNCAVLSAAATDLDAHAFGEWDIGSSDAGLGARFAETGRELARMLAAQAASAAALADTLADAVASVQAADENAAHPLAPSGPPGGR